MAQPVQTAPSLDPALARHQRVAFVVIGAVAVLNIVMVWGYTGVFWDEHGRWLDEVARYARGELPYRDFGWKYPPLALWLVGGVARLTGTSLSAISATTAALFLVLVTVFLHQLRRLAPHLVLPIALPALLCASAYASRAGVPLPLGTISPAGPVGFICLLGAAGLMIAAVDSLSLRTAALSGAMTGLALLSKQDYWLPSIYVMLAGTALLARRSGRRALLAAPAVACTVTALAGFGVAVAHSGLTPLVQMLAGSNDVLDLAARTLPSLERLTVEVAATAALTLLAVTSLWLCLAISDRNAGRWAAASGLVFLSAMAIHLGMSIAIGRDLALNGPEPFPTLVEETIWFSLRSGRGLFAAALVLFDERLQTHLFPVLLPPILLAALVLHWRAWYDRTLANRLALLLGLCVVARLHRGFESAAWYNVLLELPCYALFLELLCGPARQNAARAVRAALSVMILLGIYARLSLGRGPLTFEGRLPVTVTRAGPVHWPALWVEMYRRADSLVTSADPSGTRPLLAFGASGGWNYFLGRKNPTPATGGMDAGPLPLDSVLTLLGNRREPLLLLDNRWVLRATPAPVSSPLRWEPEPMPNRYVRVEREPFERLSRDCTPVAPDTTAAVALWNCAPR